jgi:CubicO group peptidase (beta-lactamase class C family)
MRYNQLTIALGVLVIGLNLARAAEPSQASAAGLDGVILQKMHEARIVGLGAAIIRDDKVVWSKGYGFADKDRALPFTSDTVMNIGSISKTFTGVALMQAVQAGKLSLDADINQYLPFRVVNPHFPDARITLRHLATHTSGITDRDAVYETTYHYGGAASESLGGFLKSYLIAGGRHYAADNFLNVRPGTHREYSNIAAGLAGYIVEIATGNSLSAYGRAHIFRPLGMRSTGWSLADVDLARHSKLYVMHGGWAIPVQLYEGTTYPDGGVRTTVSDLSKFFIALLNGGTYEGARILDQKSVDEMERFQFTEANKPDNVDLKELNSGLFWATKYNGTRIGHNGTDPGVMTEMLATPDKGTAVILFSNTSLDGQQSRAYLAIHEELWKYAEALPGARASLKSIGP